MCNVCDSLLKNALGFCHLKRYGSLLLYDSRYKANADINVASIFAGGLFNSRRKIQDMCVYLFKIVKLFLRRSCEFGIFTSGEVLSVNKRISGFMCEVYFHRLLVKKSFSDILLLLKHICEIWHKWNEIYFYFFNTCTLIVQMNFIIMNFII